MYLGMHKTIVKVNSEINHNSCRWSCFKGSVVNSKIEHSDCYLGLLLTLIPAWLRNYIHYKVWDENIYPFANFNSAAVEVWEWMSNFIPHFAGHMFTYPDWDLELIGVSKTGLCYLWYAIPWQWTVIFISIWDPKRPLSIHTYRCDVTVKRWCALHSTVCFAFCWINRHW